jgi:homoserine acetyltransferase
MTMSSQASSEPLQTYSVQNFKFCNGATLPKLNLAYKILNPHNSKIAVVHTCFKGRLDTTLTHANGALRNHKIILIALLGNGESSSPSNTKDFPEKIEYMDCISAQHQLLTKELGIKEVDVMLGFSMGGQITYHWITTHPDFIKHAVVVCSSAKTSRHNFQFLEGPRAALENAKSPELGIRAFGKAYSAWLTSAEWFDQECYKALGLQNLRDWDDIATIQGYEGWNGEDLLVMLGMWQRGDISRCKTAGGVKFANTEDPLQGIKAKVLLMPCETDQYFRPYVSEKEVLGLENGSVEVVPSIWGHIGGGGANEKDTEWMDNKIKLFLRGLN